MPLKPATGFPLPSEKAAVENLSVTKGTRPWQWTSDHTDVLREEGRDEPFTRHASRAWFVINRGTEMFEKPYHRYHIPNNPAPNTAPHPDRFKVQVNRINLAALLLEELLHHPTNLELVTSRPCVYGVFSGPIGGFAPRPHLCVGCLRCTVQYPEVIQIHPNPERIHLGDSFLNPDMVDTIIYESSTGRVPVRGAGYGGQFGGEGWDSMWTDMSEIVRPTRDGIHGREYISTSVDIGYKPAWLTLDERGEPIDNVPMVHSLPVPMLIDRLPHVARTERVYRSLLQAAEILQTMVLIPFEDLERFDLKSPFIIPILSPERPDVPREGLGQPKLIELEGWSEGFYEQVKSQFPGALVAIRLPFQEELEGIIDKGPSIFHLTADYHGTTPQGFVMEAIRRTHDSLVSGSLREQVTLIGSGGIVAAEHVPKAIICGLDLVALDTSLCIALQGRFQGEVRDGEGARIALHPFDPNWGTQRLVNLFASWRDQILEILGAMGLREIRRLRGEVGRAMWMQDIEAEAFSEIPGYEVNYG